MAFSSDRRGSALLIVLGMVAFMVVSAVGFSIYMRQSRMPSSMLRRTTSAHELARAALVEAMASIESALENAPAPGVGGTTANSWMGRVLTPGGTSGMLDPSDTVSPFTLESLAYMPPALVNDIRYYSRRSKTATWNRLDFDAGRSAFCAVDVSDYFDLNRVAAAVPRGSGDDSLVTLAYLFQNGTYTGYAADPVKFQNFLDDVEDSAEGPFASLADYNLALASLGSSTGLTSPFVEFLKRGTGVNGFYGFTRPDENSADFRKVALQRFVTDGNSNLTREEWIADTSSGNAKTQVELDISNPRNQPFPDLMKKDDDKSNDDDASTVTTFVNDFWDKYADCLGTLPTLALYDYLDADDVPISVIAPTVERAPMIVGIDAVPDLRVSIEEKESDLQQNELGGNLYEERKTVDFCLKVSGSVDVNAGFAFPFKWQKERNASAGDFSAVAQAAFYMIAQDSVAVAGQSGKQGCTAKVDGALKSWPTKSGEGASDVREGGVVVMTSTKGTTGLPSEDVDTEKKAVSAGGGRFRDVQLTLDGFEKANGRFESDYPIVRFYLYRKYRRAPGSMSETPDIDWCLESDAQIEGARQTEYKMQAMDFSTGDLATGGAGTYTWGMGLSVSLRNNNGKLVDMAPAHALDDDSPAPEGFGDETRFKTFPRGLLRFDNKDEGCVVEIKDGFEGYNALHERVKQGDLTNKQMQFNIATYLTDDPRYNFAAGNWYPVTAPDGSLGEAWLERTTCDGAGGKDGDIFMSVSNQGYLQDAGEIAFLPRVCPLRDADTECKAITDVMRNGRIPTGAGDCGNSAQMWRTYGCFGKLDANYEVDSLGMTSPVNGFRINPYTDDDTIRLGAFMNTPYDWWSAGTNYVKDAIKKTFADQDGRASDMTKPLKYTFGPSGTGNAKIDADKMKEFSAWMGTKLRSATDGKWWNKWDDIDWLGGEVDDQLGVELHDVDRKFLHSYWRKCFANQQQLFLVFFRAEPVVLGGGSGEGSTPAQLGAKGVAVVWRDPRRGDSSQGSGTDGSTDVPHAMRVLFYHQVN
ncbi:MAG: hypothetical protein J6U17_04995 [Kiritimatiellae bacterium]|nr:hypothetical protein [Kiritimatiellia bacterium]